jgi:hypothetical protein
MILLICVAKKIASSFLLAMTFLVYFEKLPSREGLGVCFRLADEEIE